MVSKRDIKEMEELHNVRGLMELIDHPKEKIQKQALRSLGSVALNSVVTPQCFDAVARKATSTCSGVRFYTISLLTAITTKSPELSEKAIDIILPMLEDERSNVSGQAAIMLKFIADKGDERVIRALIKALYRFGNFEKEDVIVSLALIGDWRVMIHFARFLDNFYINSGLAAIHGILRYCEYGDDFLVDPIVKHGLTRKAQMEVRTRCAEALGIIGDPRAIEPLKKYSGPTAILRGNYIAYPSFLKEARKAIKKIESGNYPKRKKRRREEESVPTQARKSPCPTCRNEMSFIKEYRRWYCDECEDYAPKNYRTRDSRQEQQAPKPEPEEEEYSCSECGAELSYIEEYESWYCYECEEYADF